MKKEFKKDLNWYNTNIAILDRRLKTSDFSSLQSFAIGLHAIKELQQERQDIYSIPYTNQTYKF